MTKIRAGSIDAPANYHSEEMEQAGAIAAKAGGWLSVFPAWRQKA